MKTFSLLLAACCFATSLRASPPHPSVLTVKYGDNMLPVVRVTSAGPYVMVDGKEKLVRSSPVYLVQEAGGFSDNFVQSPRGGLGGRVKTEILGDHGYDPSRLYMGGLTFSVPLTAEKTIKGGFAVIVFYTEEAFTDHPVPAEVFVHELPELPAGTPVRVKFNAAVRPHTLEPKFFVQIFESGGREVRTSDAEHAWSYYAQRDRARFARALEKYLEQNKGADHDAVPVSTPKPVFKSTAVLPKGEVVITLTIEPEGTVSSVNAGNVADDSARNSLIEAMSGWLFLPKLKAGQPVSTFMQVPLQF